LNGITPRRARRYPRSSQSIHGVQLRLFDFVAAKNPAKRKELDQSVIKTFYLSNLSQTTELQDVVNAMRTLLEVQRWQLQSQNAIIVRVL
jgi:hypothetical protein